MGSRVNEPADRKSAKAQTDRQIGDVAYANYLIKMRLRGCRKYVWFWSIFLLCKIDICCESTFDMFVSRTRYDIDPLSRRRRISNAKHISNAAGVYRRSCKGSISMGQLQNLVLQLPHDDMDQKSFLVPLMWAYTEAVSPMFRLPPLTLAHSN